VVGLDLSADDDLAETERGLDDHVGRFAGGGIDREGDAGLVAIHHLLDDDGDLRLAGELERLR